MRESHEIDPHDELEALLQAQDRERARSSLIDFTKYTFPLFRESWHHRLMAEHMEALVKGLITRLLVLAPPRHTKSELFSRRLPAYAFGLDPNEFIMSCSYGADLATNMNRDVQRIMADNPYRALFKTRIQDSTVTTNIDQRRRRSGNVFEIVGSRGVYVSAGVGGAITGKGFTLGLVDDPIKNQEEANSASHRQKVWEWFSNVFYTRRQKGSRIGVTLTHWNEDDLAGRIIKHLASLENEDGEPWTILRLPAIAEGELHPRDRRKPGEALWPSEYGLPFLNEQKRTLGTRGFASLYQQRPTPQEGNIIKRKWWKFYDAVPDSFDDIAHSWDFTMTDEGNPDYVAGVVVGLKGADAYVLDLFNEQVAFTDGVKALLAMTSKHPSVIKKYVEKAANGFATLNVLKKTVPGLIGVTPRGSKEDRVNACSPLIEAGNVYLPSSLVAKWAPLIVEQFAAFPKGEHDDIVDAITQALIKMVIRKRPSDFMPQGTKQVNTWNRF